MLPSRPALVFWMLLVGPVFSTAESPSWPQWRGPDQTGVAREGTFPTVWSEASATFKVNIPGSGASTPVLHQNTAYLTSGVEGKNTLLAIDTSSGKMLWQRQLGTDRGAKHRKGSGSNPSPVTNGDFVVAYFRSGDLACVNLAGDVVWQMNLQEKFAEDSLWWDLGTSPLLMNGRVVIAVMQTGPSYVLAVDIATGQVRWKHDRVSDAPMEAAQSYSTPVAARVGEQDVVAVLGADMLTLHHVDSGKELGRVGGLNPKQEQYFRSIASPVVSGNLIVCPYARGLSLTAVDLRHITESNPSDAVSWTRDDLGSDVPTPAVHQQVLYVVNDSKQDKGVVTAVDLQTGKTLWNVKLPRTRNSYSASPLIAGDHLYVTNEDGATSVVGPLSQPAPSVIAENRLDDDEAYTVASMIPLNNALLLRTKSHLYRID